jgi:hypothetical protein
MSDVIDFLDKISGLKASETQRISMLIRPLLVGAGPEVQSGVLADLLSLWLAGHAPQVREELLQAHMQLVRDLVKPSEIEMFGEDWQHPSTISLNDPW